ncbi:response regulator [Christensenellaceae bacterium OttesenSCG-928-L17]|nr:response regulator [Christensenellaceae bacterium OttesenSCG-928-L17]
MRMKVMIVDDEPIAAQATSVMVQRTNLQLEIAGLCFSGREAIVEADILRPDIIVMDIQMSGINGLEAIRRIAGNHPRTKFIILSAYSEFSYAVEALELGASDYLLKPVRQAELTACMQKVVTEIQARKEDMDAELMRQEQLEIVEPMMQSSFIRALMPGAKADESLLLSARFLGIENAAGYMLALYQKDHADNAVSSGVLFERVPLHAGSMSGMVRPGLYGVFVPVNNQEENTQAHRAEIAARIHQELVRQKSLHGREITAGIGEMYHGAVRMKHSFAQAMNVLGYLDMFEEPAMRCMVYTNEMEGLGAAFDIGGDHPRTPALVQQVVQKAMDYIETYSHRNITLDEVASIVNLSPHYFSRFFKEHTGSNFSEVLVEVRIEKAKQLLRNTECSIKDIAFQVGYNDPNYFSKAFHKVTGIRASDYKAAQRAAEKKGGSDL